MENRILSSLPVHEYVRFSTQLENIALSAGEVIYEPGQRIDYLYFPTSAVVNLVHTTRSGVSAEVWTTGSEGVVSVHALLLSETMPMRAAVQSSGLALRLRAEVVQDEFRRGAVFQGLLLRYIQLVINYTAQVAICNRLHSFEERLCRWLLLSFDRASCSHLKMTHDYIAMMLGGRRESVTTAARQLQQAELINYSRGNINVVDKIGLQQRACECYAVMKDESDGFHAFVGAAKGSSELQAPSTLRPHPAYPVMQVDGNVMNRHQ